MRQVFLSLFILLFCLISSCTKENVRSVDDKIQKVWNVESSSIHYIGIDTINKLDWTTTDSTYITFAFEDSVVTRVVLDSLLNIKPGKPDSITVPYTQIDADLVKIGFETFYIRHLTNTGMELEYKNTFYDNPPFHTEERYISLRPLK